MLANLCGAFKSHPGYDHYILDGDFNGAYIFLDFYYADDPEMRAVSYINWPEYRADFRFRDLYAVRADRYNAIVQSRDPLRRHVKIVDLIRYPNGQIAMYLSKSAPPTSGRVAPFRFSLSFAQVSASECALSTTLSPTNAYA